MKFHIYWLHVFMLLTAALSVAIPAQAQDATPVSDDSVNEVAQDLFCPVCENTPLDVCPTQACAQWRELIRQKLSIGWSEKQIQDYFVEQYGDQVLALPPRKGLNWIVYVLPPLGFIAGLILIISILKRSKKPATPATPQSPASSRPSKKVMDTIEEDILKEED